MSFVASLTLLPMGQQPAGTLINIANVPGLAAFIGLSGGSRTRDDPQDRLACVAQIAANLFNPDSKSDSS